MYLVSDHLLSEMPPLSSVDSEGRSSRASGTGSPSCYRDAADATYTETANFQSCKDTLHTNASKTLVDSANRPHSSLSGA